MDRTPTRFTLDDLSDDTALVSSRRSLTEPCGGGAIHPHVFDFGAVFKRITMTEQEWRECTDPIMMLTVLGRGASKRKARLFSVACCRAIWHLLPNSASRDAVDMAERYCDGLVKEDDLWVVHDTAQCCAIFGPSGWSDFALAASIYVSNPDASTAGRGFDLVSENADWVANCAFESRTRSSSKK